MNKAEGIINNLYEQLMFEDITEDAFDGSVSKMQIKDILSVLDKVGLHCLTFDTHTVLIKNFYLASGKKNGATSISPFTGKMEDDDKHSVVECINIPNKHKALAQVIKTYY